MKNLVLAGVVALATMCFTSEAEACNVLKNRPVRTVVGNVLDRQPVRTVARGVLDRQPVRNTVGWVVDRQPVRRTVRGVWSWVTCR